MWKSSVFGNDGNKSKLQSIVNIKVVLMCNLVSCPRGEGVREGGK